MSRRKEEAVKLLKNAKPFQLLIIWNMFAEEEKRPVVNVDNCLSEWCGHTVYAYIGSVTENCVTSSRIVLFDDLLNDSKSPIDIEALGEWLAEYGVERGLIEEE